MSVTIWHNPRCSKSRQTLALIEEKGINPEIRLYLEDAPSVAELDEVLTKLGRDPRQLMRTKEDAYVDNDMGNESLSRAQLLTLMNANPKVIERPVVIKGDQAAVGRPPEDVLVIL